MNKGLAAVAAFAFVFTTVTAFPNCSPTLASAAYSYDGEYVNGIREKTIAASVDGTVKRNGIVLSSSAFVGTGDVLTSNSRDYKVVVKGDVNGDGTVGTADFLMIRDSYLRKIELTEVKAIAADVNGGGIGTADFLMVRDHYLSKTDIYPSDSSDIFLDITSGSTGDGTSYSSDKFSLIFEGDWDMVTAAGYKDSLTRLFYTVYPRVYKRWGNGTEPKTITFKADKDYDGVAYCAGTLVCVSVDFANANPDSIGFFSHEITHSVQQYNDFEYGGDAWWTENMANYGGFRYFHWSNPKYVQVYSADDTSLQDWGYDPYGNNKWFFAYMDSRYPTRKSADGKLTYGLIDSINFRIKSGELKNDDPRNTADPFNRVVKEITGYDCIESLRQRFVRELKDGTWNFTGFGNYTDNFLTEGLDGLPDPTYPMIFKPVHGNKTAIKLSAPVTGGDNLCLGASVKASGHAVLSERGDMLIDGNPDTKWCCVESTDATCCLDGTKYWAVIDLGKKTAFNTYTLFNTGTREYYGNMTEWEILISDDGKHWSSADYQKTGDTPDIVSYDIGNVSARYVMLRVYNGDGSGGTVRLYEFSLYMKS